MRTYFETPAPSAYRGTKSPPFAERTAGRYDSWQQGYSSTGMTFSQ